MSHSDVTGAQALLARIMYVDEGRTVRPALICQGQQADTLSQLDNLLTKKDANLVTAYLAKSPNSEVRQTIFDTLKKNCFYDTVHHVNIFIMTLWHKSRNYTSMLGFYFPVL